MTEIMITPQAPQPGRADPVPSSETAAASSSETSPNESRTARRGGLDPLFGVRTADIEPYTGLRYLSKLFKMIAVVLVLLLLAEVGTGLYHDGVAALSTLLAEVSRLIVLAGLLWGVGDLAILLIDVGHDVRAARILIGRQTAHLTHHAHEAQIAGPTVRAPLVGESPRADRM